jgi:hypothetical protein
MGATILAKRPISAHLLVFLVPKEKKSDASLCSVL